jgi:SPP1 gp7 family putative phage head morphogenesis protein
MSNPNGSILAMLAKFERERDKQSAVVLKQLGSAYSQLYKRLSEKIELEARRIFENGGETVSRTWIIDRLSSLREQMTDEIKKFSVITEGAIDGQTLEALTAGGKQATAMMDAVAGGTRGFVSVNFAKLNTAQIDTMLAFLAPGSPLRDNIAKMTGYHTEKIVDQLVEAIALGYNPYKTAKNIAPFMDKVLETAKNGMASVLSDAVRMARTAQIYTYRAAAQANYQANDDVVSGWQWNCSEDELVCPACLSLHGKVFDNDEMQDGHYNCRCFMTPVVLGQPLISENAGQEYFDSLSEAEQRSVMGDKAYDAYQNGDIGLKDFSKQVDEQTYGTMRVTPTLKELIGGE